jgi:transposase
MTNQLDMRKSLAIRQLHQQGMSQRDIAQTLGVSRGAVIRHLDADGSNSTKAQTGEVPTGSQEPNSTKAPTGVASNPKAPDGASEPSEAAAEIRSRSRCAPLHQVILDKLALGLDSQRIYQDLVCEHGFQDKYWSVVRYVKNLGSGTELPFRRLEVEPGTELQVDFGTGRRCRDHSGNMRKTYVFRAVLSHSRKGYTEVVTRQTTENFIRCLESTFHRLGGVPQTVVFDNAKCAVLKADWYDPELHPKLLDFCKHYGFVLLPTRPGTPRHKGKVERGVDYVQENALKGKNFDTLQQQNEYLSQWEQSVADTRIHGTTKKQVREAFELERPHLTSLAAERFPFYHEAQRRVSRDGHIAVGKAFYSISPEYLGCDVWVRWNSKTVRVLNHRLEQIAIHCTLEPGRFSTQADHIAPEKTHTIERGIEYLLRKVRFLGDEATRWAEATLEARGIEGQRTIQGLLSLSRKYESPQISNACEIAWRSQCFSYRAIKRLMDKQATTNQQTMDFMDDHPMIRSMSEYGEFINRAIHGGCQ